MEYTIKSFIKEKKETFSSVADKLHLSRPTFDSYIYIYEREHNLPKIKYKQIFDYLFLDYAISDITFKNRLDLCNIYLSQKKENENEQFLKDAECSIKLIEEIQKKICKQNYNVQLLKTIDIIVSNYEDESFRDLLQILTILYNSKSVMHKEIYTNYIVLILKLLNKLKDENKEVNYSVTELPEHLN